MALDPQNAVAADAAQPPPRMLERPADVTTPVGRVADTRTLRTLRDRRAGQHAAAGPQSPRLRARAWAARLSGRADRRVLFALADATETIAAAHDALADRVASSEAVTADVGATFGEEIARLRAEVIHLQTTVAALRPGDDE